MADISPLLAPIEELAALPSGASTRASYKRLREALVTVFPGLKSEPDRVDRFGLEIALSHAVRATGLPGTAAGVTTEFVAAMICDAVKAREAEHVYMCPLNYSAELQPRKFGWCEVRKFTQPQLEAELQMPRLMRQSPRLQLDTKTLSLFQWLIVRDTLPLPARISERSLPMFHEIAGRDFGEIIPHAHLWPPTFEKAAFAMLLLPWEDLVDKPSFDWRPFRIPWVYTSNHDPFVHLDIPKDAGTLALEPVGYEAPATGEWDEWERPVRTELADDNNDALAPLTDQRWNDINRALVSPIFNRPVMHFLVRAFASDNIDEFLAHIITIDAALGRPEDFDVWTRPHIGGRNLGATERVARRVGAILSDAGASRDYKDLFKLRSDFIHGSPLATISSQTRVKARRLARRVADALVGATSVTTHQTRDSFLSALCP